MAEQPAEHNTGTVIHTTIATLAAAVARHLDYYRAQGLPVEEMEVVLALHGKNRLTSWSLQWPDA